MYKKSTGTLVKFVENCILKTFLRMACIWPSLPLGKVEIFEAFEQILGDQLNGLTDVFCSVPLFPIKLKSSLTVRFVFLNSSWLVKTKAHTGCVDAMVQLYIYIYDCTLPIDRNSHLKRLLFNSVLKSTTMEPPFFFILYVLSQRCSIFS